MIENPRILGKSLFFEGGNSLKINFLVKNGYKGIYLTISRHYFNPVLFSCGPCDSAYLTLYMNIFSPEVFEIFG